MVEDLVSFINESYPYSLNKEIVFGSETVSYRHLIKKGVPLCRLVLLGAILIYLKWKNLSNEERNKYISKHFLNVNRLFNRLYKDEPFNIYSAVYVLYEGSKDVLENKDNSFFNGLISVNEPCEFGKMNGVLDELMLSDSHTNIRYSAEYIAELLEQAVKSLTVVKEYEAFNDNGLYFKKDNEILKDDNILIISDYYYYLLSEIREYRDRKETEYIGFSALEIMVNEEKR